MPWYIIMLLLMLIVQKRYRYSIKEIIFFGGVYEIGADGFIGSLFEGNLFSGLFASILVLPLFVVVYKTYCASSLLFHKAGEKDLFSLAAVYIKKRIKLF
jgi:uncharacterized membrane protein